jgi:uncharacterized membrane protein YhaH (DUF805 family)
LQFIIGYLASAVICTMLLFVVLALMLSANPQMLAGGSFYGLQALAPFFIPVFVVLAGLISGRAHDCGWPAWPVVAVFAGALLIVEVSVRSVFGTPTDPFWRFGHSLAPTIFAIANLLSVLLPWACMITLLVTPGQKSENRFGAASAGLGV